MAVWGELENQQVCTVRLVQETHTENSGYLIAVSDNSAQDVEILVFFVH